MSRTYRIAFLAPVYVTEPNAGGMASYLARMARALTNAGNVPEIFALSKRGPAVTVHNDIAVHLVNPDRTRGRLRWYRTATRIPPFRGFRGAAEILSGAAQLAEAFERRDAEDPFDLVQTSEYCATGWYLKPRSGLVHVVRCSGARELLYAVDQGDSQSMHRSRLHYELESVRRSELAYAPSEFVAEYYRRKLNRAIPVVRPPLHVEIADSAATIPRALPGRYLLHFGQLRTYKGTMWLLDSLPLAWEMAPDLQMLLVGPVRDATVRSRLHHLLRTERRLTHLETVDRPIMYAILKRAAAAVLPSLADNLPNTVIESLGMGIPVIGSDGASINELVVHGRHGELLPMNDRHALAAAMARAWLGESVRPGFKWDAPIVAQMEPNESVMALGNLVNMDLAGKRSLVQAQP